MSRIRSPNYPAFSLPTAIERVRAIHSNEGKNPASRETLVKHMGFGGINGASATALSALGKYGLLEAVGDGEWRVSDLAIAILFPHDEGEKLEAIRTAAYRPALFAKLREKWPDRAPSEENLRSYLVREGFAQGVVPDVIQYYRETSEIARGSEAVHDSTTSKPAEAKTTMEQATAIQAPAPPLPPGTPGKPFTIAFDGAVLTGTIAIKNVRDIDRLMRVLKAQKSAFEAMQDDDLDDLLGKSDEDEQAHERG